MWQCDVKSWTVAFFPKFCLLFRNYSQFSIAHYSQNYSGIIFSGLTISLPITHRLSHSPLLVFTMITTPYTTPTVSNNQISSVKAEKQCNKQKRMVWKFMPICTVLFPDLETKDSLILERVQWRASKYILNDYVSDYKLQPRYLGLLPLSLWLDLCFL